MPTETLSIDPRFHGPPRSGNGGYVCGLTARYIDGPCSVRLKAPPPLSTALELLSDVDGAQLLQGDTLIAEARPARFELDVPPAPHFDEALQASEQFLGFTYHPFPSCFVCGPRREPGDGLCLFPGPLAGSDRIAAPWRPDASLGDSDGLVKPEFLWAALDCPGAFVLMPLPEGKGIVLGELIGEILNDVQVGEPCVVCAWPIGREGKKYYAGTAIYRGDSKLAARAQATWIEIPLQNWQ